MKLAWLSGLWDGEGSIGLARSKRSLVLQIQMSMTCEATLREAVRVLSEHGVRVRGPYTYTERNSEHKPAWLIAVGGMGNVRKMAELLIPYAVTKRRLWELALEWIGLREQAAGGFDEQGRLKRGGSHRTGYTEGDIDCAKRLRAANDSRRHTRRNHELDDLVAP